jgi:Flp pilus assembly protein TadD
VKAVGNPVELAADGSIPPDLFMSAVSASTYSQGERRKALAVPLAAAVILIALALVPGVRGNPTVVSSFAGAAAILIAWTAATFARAARSGRRLGIEVVLRPQHYLQACAHLSILTYWGWYWREVYDSAPLIAAQLAFAYAFDSLLTWSRRDTYTLGFGPFPIVFSTNLFLWFKPDWFYLQFLMIAVGFAAKELIRWNKEGRQTHIFNPSSFTLTVFSLLLILTGTTGITWGPEISITQMYPPHIYLLIFAVSLPAQLLFGTATMTLSAVATTYLFGVVYYAVTGTNYWFPGGGFFEDPIPIAVFLGMHLLFTDPSTSPRTEFGRVVFGVLYGLSVVALISVLIALNLPGHYDKLLPVPLLNLMIRAIDRAANSKALKRFNPAALGKSLLPRQRNLAYMSMWVAFFVTMQVLVGAQTTLIRGDMLVQEGRIEEGIERYREFVSNDAGDPLGHQKLGTALMEAGRFEEAVPALRRASELNPGNPDVLNSLGTALIQIGRPEDATASFQRAIELQPDNQLAQGNLGLALLRTGRAREAVAPLQRVASLHSGTPEAHRNLGVALMRSGQIDAAVGSLQRAVQLQPDHADAHNALGEVLIQAARFPEAVTTLKRAVELNPAHPEAHYNLANALATLGQPKAAQAEFREAVRLKPDWPLALASLAGLEAMSPEVRDAEDALRLATRAADLTGRRDPYILMMLARAQATAGRFVDATRTAEEAHSLAPASHLAAQISADLVLYRARSHRRQ